jgi:hypothetical protein
MSAWRTFAALSGRERALLVAAGVVVAGVRAALILLPSRLIIRYISRLGAHTNEREPHTVPLSEVIWAVEAVTRRLRGSSCVTESVSALLLLRRHGYAARFCVGVARGPRGDFQAHAWLEREGRTVIGRRVQQYVRLPDLAGVPAGEQRT